MFNLARKDISFESIFVLIERRKAEEYEKTTTFIKLSHSTKLRLYEERKLFYA